jgi:hypothetical protein
MGEDYVELIFAIETAFQIAITDEEANNASSISDLHKLVVGKLKGPDSKRCLRVLLSIEPARDQAFHRLR